MRRSAVVSGRFYPAEAHETESFIKSELPENIQKLYRGVIVPHAGWVFSGGMALRALAALKGGAGAVIVLLGAVHRYGAERPAVYPEGAWETPLGDLPVARDLISEYFDESLFLHSARAHEGEHAIEVQLPFLKHLYPDSRIIPVSVPPGIQSGLGDYLNVFEKLKEEHPETIFAASTDLTHYGLHYGDSSFGSGAAGYEYVTRRKDPEFIKRVNGGHYREIIPYAMEHESACGPGGVALLCGLFRKGTIRLLEYTTSYDRMPSGGMHSFVTYGSWGLQA
jgi:hypothetical protein